MIIYGWNSKNIKQAPISTYKCPSCGEHNSHIAIFSSYFHIFWIPVFVYKKSAQIVCMSCNFSAEQKKLDPEMRQNVKLLKSSVSNPKYLYAGSILIVLAIGYFTFMGIKNSQLESGYLDNPQIGDVYVLKDLDETSPYDHYLLKVSDIVDDSLYMTFNSYSYDRVVSKLDPKDGFYDVWYSMHKKELDNYEKSGELRKVIRDYSTYSGFNRTIPYSTLDSIGQEEEYVTEPAVQGF